MAAIGRALMARPRLLMIDELSLGLAPVIIESLVEIIEQINRDGMTVICSLHFLSLARTYGTRVIALKGGQLMFDGLPSQIDADRFRSIYGEDAVEVEIE